MQTLVLSLNPAIDLEWQVREVRWEEKNTIESERRWAGGKGVNVARWLRFLGGHPRLLMPAGGSSGRELVTRIRAEGLPVHIVPIQEATREDIIVTTVETKQLRFNPRGPLVSTAEWRNIDKVLDQELRKSSQIIISGSMPRGAEPTLYARIVKRACQSGVRVLLDCDGPAFAAAVKERPFLVKPNQHELEQWCERSLRTDKALKTAAMELSRQTGGWVLVSRGPKPACLVHNDLDTFIQAPPPPLKIQTTVGAGDALLAGVASRLEQDAPPETWLKWGVTAGVAATQCQAGELPKRRQFDQWLKMQS